MVQPLCLTDEKAQPMAKLTDRVWCGGAKLTELVVTKGWGGQHVGMELRDWED